MLSRIHFLSMAPFVSPISHLEIPSGKKFGRFSIGTLSPLSSIISSGTKFAVLEKPPVSVQIPVTKAAAIADNFVKSVFSEFIVLIVLSGFKGFVFGDSFD